MKQVKVRVVEGRTKKVRTGNLIITIRGAGGDSCNIVIGCPGQPNVEGKMKIGDAILVETIVEGIVEVRLAFINYSFWQRFLWLYNVLSVYLIISKVVPRPGFSGGMTIEDLHNSPFTSDERDKIATSMKSAEEELRQQADVSPEQADLISRKFDELAKSAERFGRKDWINFVAGTLTNLCVTGAFNQEVSRSVFNVVGSALSWLSTNVHLLLP